MKTILTANDIAGLAGNRELYIWGSGHFGAAISYAISRFGLRLSGFIDSNMAGREFQGFLVKAPQEILAGAKGKVFILIAAFLFAEDIAKYCRELGYVHREDFLLPTDLKPFHFEMDVSGVCNLKCLTCPRGDSSVRPGAKMMKLADYKKVVDKLMAEIPLLSDVQLYSWGEPLLNPELPQMISYAASKGLAVAISSNLSLHCDLEPVVKAAPAWFRLSISGSGQEMYSVIHRGGDFDLVVENMRKLSELRARLAPKMFVDVNYHLYKHNLDGVQKMIRLCNELGFVLRTNYAYIDPLDHPIDYASGVPLPPRMAEGIKHLLIDFDQALAMSKSSGLHDCVSETSFVIHSDLSFRRCTHLYYHPDNILAANFLETSMDEILLRKDKCEICLKCRELGVHRFHFAYIDKGVDAGKASEG